MRTDTERGGGMTLLDEATWSGKIFQDGWVPGGGGEISDLEPATGEELARVGSANADDVARAARRGSEAQPAWAATGYQERAAIIRRAASLFEEHGEEIQGWIVRETGAIPPKTDLEIWFAATTCYESAGLTSQPYGELLQTRDPVLSLSRRLPVGVVGVISPFNFPLILSIRAVAPALALGNAVILKPDPRTSVAGGVVLARIFAEAGLPDGLFSLMPGGADGQSRLREDLR